MEIDRRLRLEATRSLGKIGNIRESLRIIGRNPEGFKTRVNEFGLAMQTMDSLLQDNGFNPTRFRNLGEFKNTIRNEPLTQPNDLIYLHDEWKNSGGLEYEETAKSLLGVFPKVSNLITSGEWKFPTTITDDPNKLASCLLVEGYGLLLEDIYAKPGLARRFVLGFEEILISHLPDSALLADVVDWMVEDKSEFSAGVQADIEERTTEPQTDLEITIREVNKAFRMGEPALFVTDKLRTLSRPIAVDFNNVIANNVSPLELNPDAPSFLSELKQIGNVIIVTGMSDWNSVRDFLAEKNLWSRDMVLMTAPTYDFLTAQYGAHPKIDEIRDGFLDTSKKLGWKVDRRDLRITGKRIAPIFGKTFKIPIIDNDPDITEDNPGMLGINVESWETDEELKKYYETTNQGKPSLSEAVEIVRNYYAQLDK